MDFLVPGMMVRTYWLGIALYFSVHDRHWDSCKDTGIDQILLLVFAVK